MTSKSAQNLVNKIYEVDYFLSQLNDCDNKIAKAGYVFSAFVTSARSVSFVIQYLGKDLDGFEKWYEIKQNFLKNCEISRYLLKWRNHTQKTGELPILTSSSNEDMKSNVSFGFSKQLGIAPKFNDSDDVGSLCYYYFLIMLKISYDFLNQFECNFHDSESIKQRLNSIHDNSPDIKWFTETEIEKIAHTTPAMKVKKLIEKYGMPAT